MMNIALELNANTASANARDYPTQHPFAFAPASVSVFYPRRVLTIPPTVLCFICFRRPVIG
jgi:hypothetical protein